MTYLNGTIGILSGTLPSPHEGVRIEVGPKSDDRLYVTYRGSASALVASTAIDRHMVEGTGSTVPRDSRGRPYQCHVLDDGTLQVTRWFVSVKSIADLPGILGLTRLYVDVLRPRRPRLTLMVRDPEA